ncbi:hypothetical protein [Leuconostoc citreum]
MMLQHLSITDLQPIALGYEEGQDVTPELLKRAERVYQAYHDKYLSIKDEAFKNEKLRSALISHDVSLEFFVNQARSMVRYGRTDSLDIFSYYLEYNDGYGYLRDVLNKMCF